ncbi:MAG: hypothetical protein HY707_00225 [Ignavibacteriae bacterium]|nr:hypothetical protein [Ignavibacteriota bacterium]
MIEIDYTALQQKYGGRYIARRDGDVIANAETYDELIDRLENEGAQWEELIIEYVEPVNIVCVY